ncbi:TPA: terminase family protein [Enterobacter ludwigii]
MAALNLSLTPDEQREADELELLRLLEEEDEFRRTNGLYYYSPYGKQQEFIEAGADYPERCFMAGNQLGKTLTGGAEVTFHLTGRYPGTDAYPSWGVYKDEWKGRRFEGPVVFWVGGETNETITKSTQRILCGRLEETKEPGFGMIPKDDILSWKKSQFGPNLVDHVLVKHHNSRGECDGLSVCFFKPYSQGRRRWQADTIHGVWFDEEPPYDIYSEGLTRTNKYGQFSLLTFTPLMGMSSVVTKFLKNPSRFQKVVTMTIDHALHYTPEQREQIKEGYPEHEREARSNGTPTLGSGRIFQIPEAMIKCQPFECPPHYWVINGLDFGWDHPQAHIQLWEDRDTGDVYLARIAKRREMKADEAWRLVKPWSARVPVAWPHDGYQHEKGGGEVLKDQYAAEGFNMLYEHATWPDGGNTVEPGIQALRDLMLDGKFHVFETCTEFFEEFRLYHRDENGKIVKLHDDLISALRYAYMMRRYAVQMSDITAPVAQEYTLKINKQNNYR